MVWVAELIDQPLTSLRLLHDPFLVVLSERSRQLVIVHRWSVLRKRSLKIKQKGLLGFIERRNFAFDQKICCSSHLSLSPQSGDLDRVNDLEDSLLPIDPVDVVAIEGGLEEELLDELPQVDVGSWP